MVEVAQEVFPDSLQIPVRGVQVSAEVPRQVLQVFGPQYARADVLQLAQVAVQHFVHGGLPAVASGVSHDAARVQGALGFGGNQQLVRAVSRDVQDRSLGQSFVFQRFMMKKPRSGFVLSSSSFDWFSSKSHKKVPFFKSSSTSSAVPVPSLPGAGDSTQPCCPGPSSSSRDSARVFWSGCWTSASPCSTLSWTSTPGSCSWVALFQRLPLC